MSDFTSKQVLEYYDAASHLPEVTDELTRAAVLDALKEELEKGWNDVTVQFGAVWDRKGYPSTGSISDTVSGGTGYRSSTERSDAMILVAVVVPEYARTDATKKAVIAVAAEDERAYAEAQEAARQAKLSKAAALRAEAEKLEAEASK